MARPEGEGLTPAFVAGHSLGEYSAHVAAGTLNFADAVRTVRMRGKYMQEAVPVGVGAMAAILGMEMEKVAGVCADAAQGEVCEPANINSSEQIVISGNTGAVERAAALASERGAKRAIMLPVSAPFHCSLMKPAQIGWLPILRPFRFESRGFRLPAMSTQRWSMRAIAVGMRSCARLLDRLNGANPCICSSRAGWSVLSRSAPAKYCADSCGRLTVRKRAQM